MGGPENLTGVRRHMMPVRRLSMGDLKTTIPRGAREKTLKLALEKDETMKKWAESAWGKKLAAKEARSNMTDFDRFKLMVAKKNRAKVVKTALKKKGAGWEFYRFNPKREQWPSK